MLQILQNVSHTYAYMWCVLYHLIYVYYTYIHIFSTCCISSHFYMRAYIHLRFRMGSVFFIPCHGTSAACGSSKQASRTARPDSLMILSIRDNLRLIHWGGGKWCQKGLEKNNQTLDWFLKMSHQKTSSWPNAAFFYFLKHHFNWLSLHPSLFRNFFQTMFVQSQLQSTTKGTVQRVGKSVPIRNSAAKPKTTYSGIPPYLAVRGRHVGENLMTFPCWQSFILNLWCKKEHLVQSKFEITQINPKIMFVIAFELPLMVRFHQAEANRHDTPWWLAPFLP